MSITHDCISHVVEDGDTNGSECETVEMSVNSVSTCRRYCADEVRKGAEPRTNGPTNYHLDPSVTIVGGCASVTEITGE